MTPRPTGSQLGKHFAAVVFGSLVLLLPVRLVAGIVPLGAMERANVESLQDPFGTVVLLRVLALDYEKFVVLWQEAGAVEGPLGPVRMRQFSNDGVPFGDEVELPLLKTIGSVSAAPLGRFVATDRSAQVEVTLFNSDGTVAAETNLPDELDDSVTSAMAVVESRNGLVVVWPDVVSGLRGILGRRLKADLSLDGPPFVVTQEDRFNNYPVGPKLGGGLDGDFLVTWWAEGSTSVGGRMFNRENVALGTPLELAPASSGADGGLATCGDPIEGNFVVAWRLNSGRRNFTTLATQRSGEVEVVADRLCPGHHRSPNALACLGGGRFAIVGLIGTRRSPSLSVRAFRANGVGIGDRKIPLSVRLPGGHDPTSIAAATLSLDRLVVAWHECRPDEGDGCDVHLQRFRVDNDPSCPGDCDGDNRVTVSELVTAVRLAEGNDTAGGLDALCAAVDTDSSCTITIDELVAAVASSLTGCVG